MNYNNKIPNNKKYKQGLYIPNFKDKVLQLNNYGGLYYRSGLELKIMRYLDLNSSVTKWCAELIEIPYMLSEMKDNSLVTSQHRYYPDFYYELKKEDGTIKKVVMEVKPESETIAPKMPENPTRKQLISINYSLKMYSKNLNKWNSAIDYCKRHGFEFIIMTDKMIEKIR